MALDGLSGLSGLSGICGGGIPAWSPGTLSNLLAAPIVGLMRSAGKIWQDSGMSIPAVNNGDTVYAFQCTFTGQVFVAPAVGNVGTLKSLGSGHWGINDAGSTNTGFASSITSPLSLAICVDASSSSSRFIQAVTANCVLCPTRNGNSFYVGSDISNSFASSGYATGILTAPVSHIYWAAYLNGANVTTSNSQATWPDVCIGISVAHPSGFSTAFTGIMLTGAQFSSTDLTNVNNYFAGTHP